MTIIMSPRVDLESSAVLVATLCHSVSCHDFLTSRQLAIKWRFSGKQKRNQMSALPTFSVLRWSPILRRRNCGIICVVCSNQPRHYSSFQFPTVHFDSSINYLILQLGSCASSRFGTGWPSCRPFLFSRELAMKWTRRLPVSNNRRTRARTTTDK